MAYTFDEGLAPECYSLAWLIGSWRGFGVLGYEGLEETPFVQELEVCDDGGPYLRATSTLWRASGEAARELTGARGAQLLDRGEQWSTETSYWRPLPGDLAGNLRGEIELPEGATALEVVSADPAGHLSLYIGYVSGPRIRLLTDAVIASPSAPSLSGASRMFGLVDGDLMWAQDMAAFGKQMQPYCSGRLSRVEPVQ